MKNKLTLILCSAILAACSSTSTIHSASPGVTLKLDDRTPFSIENPVTDSYSTTSFGQYIFKAKNENGKEMQGVMPLKFNGGYIAPAILFFAPSMLYNLREMYAFYEFDLEAGVIRYKKNAADTWIEYVPTNEEVARARDYFKNM